MAQKPILKAMLICDYTIVEERTHKRTLVGLFDNIIFHIFDRQDVAVADHHI